jgi:serine phosphatase RsbU (regulator of sigma subunit)
MDYKDLFQKLQITLDKLERSGDSMVDLVAILRLLVNEFSEPLCLASGRIYVRKGGHYVLHNQYPDQSAPEGFRIPLDYGPIAEIHEHGTVLQQVGDPGVDPRLEEALGVDHFAAIGVGERNQVLIAFSLSSCSDPEQVLYTLRTIRHVVRLKFREEQLEDRVERTRQIQNSLFPTSAPSFAGYDIWSHCEPAEEVGGDLYDYLGVSDRILGIAVADAAGHGLPAALQARDAIIGLRMGVQENLRVTATIEKLNKVVSHATLASRFISLFYGELELNGTMVYCNAGHNPPYVYQNGAFEALTTGGLLLGPNPDARYQRGYVTLEPGSIFVSYTDGITEASNENGDMFGVERLQKMIETSKNESARELVNRIFDQVREFSQDDVPVDDQTVMVILREEDPGS